MAGTYSRTVSNPSKASFQTIAASEATEPEHHPAGGEELCGQTPSQRQLLEVIKQTQHRYQAAAAQGHEFSQGDKTHTEIIADNQQKQERDRNAAAAWGGPGMGTSGYRGVQQSQSRSKGPEQTCQQRRSQKYSTH